jgi:uncharacterized protein
MMIDKEKIEEFVKPYYQNKDIMHNMWHIELVRRTINKILRETEYDVNKDILEIAMYFHGFIYSDEEKIRNWLKENNIENDIIEKIIKVSWESQRPEEPKTLEGKILHDAHVLEGGVNYTIVKTLITGSVRGQSLEETLLFMKENVLNKNKCYLPETIKLCDEMNKRTNEFYYKLMEDIQE